MSFVWLRTPTEETESASVNVDCSMTLMALGEVFAHPVLYSPIEEIEHGSLFHCFISRYQSRRI